MALTVKDIMELPCGQKLTLAAGSRGLTRPVTTAEIADYEFDPDVGYDTDTGLEPSGFIITSFLFAKNDPSLILKSFRKMYEAGMSCVAYKPIIYRELPAEVAAFADENDFPVFRMDDDLWFENIIFDIMYAVQFDDKVYLSEEKIDSMLAGTMNRSELDIILKGISLKLRAYISVVFISSDEIDAGRILRSFYLLKGFHSKGLLVRYRDGLFLITTSDLRDHRSHDLIRREAFELLGISHETPMGMSDVQESASLDKAFRQSRYCYIAAAAEGRSFDCFSSTGIYRVILPAMGNEETRAFAEHILDSFRDRFDLWETASEYVSSGGDISKTASNLHCHQNTIRYRLRSIRRLTGLDGIADSELFLQLKTAFAIDRSSQ